MTKLGTAAHGPFVTLKLLLSGLAAVVPPSSFILIPWELHQERLPSPEEKGLASKAAKGRQKQLFLQVTTRNWTLQSVQRAPWLVREHM